MPANHENLEKETCEHCDGSFYSIYINKHLNSCKELKKKRNSSDESHVKCPICNKLFKEINTAHLKSHGLNLREFKIIYPDSETISKISRDNKNTLGNGRLTESISKNLSMGHTLEGRIKKHGFNKGNIVHNNAINSYKHSSSKKFYIDKYGKDIGCDLYDKKIKKMLKSREEVKAYWNNLSHYKKKYGDKVGLDKWNQKNLKNSISSRKYKGDSDSFSSYKKDVDRATSLTCPIFNIPEIHKRSKAMHLDHKVSKLYGYNNNISPYDISFYTNLEILGRSDNCAKGPRCSRDPSFISRELSRCFISSFVKKTNALELVNADKFLISNFSNKELISLFFDYIIIHSMRLRVKINEDLEHHISSLTPNDMIDIKKEFFINNMNRVTRCRSVSSFTIMEFISDSKVFWSYIFNNLGIRLIPVVGASA